MSIFSLHKKVQKSIHQPLMSESLGHASYLLALEPRIMYDAAGLVTAVDGVEDASQVAEPVQDISAKTETFQDEVFDIQEAFKEYVPPAQQTSKEIVFISTAVPDYQQLVQGVSPNAEIILLDPEGDGISQISDALASYRDLDAIHIVSHGGPGSLFLGQSHLTSGNISANAEHLSAWGESISADGDILLYGCDVAAGESGQAFIQQLSELTGADVAASTDITGAAELGGDWQLEQESGDVEAGLIFTENVLNEYSNTLAANSAPVLDNTGNMIFTSIPKDTSDSPGDLVEDVIASDGGDRITDVDADPEGIAVIAVDDTNGTWEYSVSGGAWTPFGVVSSSTATLLAADGNTSMRFLPDAGFIGTATISFHAWDQTTDANGDTGVDVADTAFSTASESAAIYVNDQPVLGGGGATPTFNEDGTPNTPIFIDTSITITDSDDTFLQSAKVTISANYVQGLNEDLLELTGGPYGSITSEWDPDTATLILSGNALEPDYESALKAVTFVNKSDNPSEAARTISFSVSDGVGYSNIVNSTVTVTAQNDAPIADIVTPHTEIIYRGSPEYQNGLSLIDQTLGHNFDIDGDPLGIAVIGVDNSNGYWEYSQDGGISWTVLDDPGTGADDLSDSYATLLANTANNRIRFVPNDPAFLGTTTISFRIWDQTAGSDGLTGFDITAIGTGGTTAFSAGVEVGTINIADPPPPPPTSDPFPEPPPPPLGGGEGDPGPIFSEPPTDGPDINPIDDYLLPKDDSPPEYMPPPEPPPEEDVLEEEQPPEEELLPEEEQVVEEEPAEEEIVEEQPAVAPIEASVVQGVVPPGEAKEAAPENNLTDQLAKEAEKAVAERAEIVKIFEDVYKLLQQQCK